MKRSWVRFNALPAIARRPIKSIVFGVVVFLVMYPAPGRFFAHLDHLDRANELPDGTAPSFAVMSEQFDLHLDELGVDPVDQAGLVAAVEPFVRERIAYDWDWNTWGVVDYLPTLEEVLTQEGEDCDGRAILAAALLRARSIDAELVGNSQHMWVRTPVGDTMNPMGEPSFRTGEDRLDVDWSSFLNARQLAFGVAVFPFTREMIILLALWVLILPGRFWITRALLSLVVLVSGLMMLRMAGHAYRFGVGTGHGRDDASTEWVLFLTLGLGYIIGAVLIMRWAKRQASLMNPNSRFLLEDPRV
jgi:hypothetical protein